MPYEPSWITNPHNYGNDLTRGIETGLGMRRQMASEREAGARLRQSRDAMAQEQEYRKQELSIRTKANEEMQKLREQREQDAMDRFKDELQRKKDALDKTLDSREGLAGARNDTQLGIAGMRQGTAERGQDLRFGLGEDALDSRTGIAGMRQGTAERGQDLRFQSSEDAIDARAGIADKLNQTRLDITGQNLRGRQAIADEGDETKQYLGILKQVSADPRMKLDEAFRLTDRLMAARKRAKEIDQANPLPAMGASPAAALQQAPAPAPAVAPVVPAVAAPVVTPAPAPVIKRIRVKDKNGKLGSIPSDQLERAKQEGYSPLE